MSTIYSLPLTNILVNGTKTYRIRTRDYDQILQHVEVSSKTNETINLNFEDLYFESIAFKGNSDLGETTLKCIRETMSVKNYTTVDSRPITCSDELKEEYLAELQFLVSRGYLIDIPVPEPIYIQNVTISGPSQISEPGVYNYYASYSPDNADTFNFVWDTYDEEHYRTIVDPTNSLHCQLEVFESETSFGDSVYMRCRDTITGTDASQFVRMNVVPPVPEPIHIQNIAISGPSQITAPGVYNYYASITPSDADEYDIDWDTVGFTDPHWYLQTDPDDPFHAQIVIPETESFGSAFYLRCEDNVSFNYDRFSISMDVYVDPPVETGNIYYGNGYKNENFKWDKETSTWNNISWGTYSQIQGDDVWTDGDNIYHSYSSNQYILDKENDTWEPYTWQFSGLMFGSVEGDDIWSDGDNIYWDTGNGGNHWMLDKTDMTWKKHTWNGFDNANWFRGYMTWTDGDNIYCSYPIQDRLYILNKETDTWQQYEFSGGSPIIPEAVNVWTDGDNIYYSYNGDNYILIDGGWYEVEFSGLTNFYGRDAWTDGDNIYYSYNGDNYILNKETRTWTQIQFDGLGSTWLFGMNVWTDNPEFRTTCRCKCGTFGRL